MAIASIPRLLHQARVVVASVLALVGGFVVVAGVVVGALVGGVGGGNLVLGWLAVLGGIAAAAGAIWVAHRVLPSSRPWYLAAYGALGTFLALTSPLVVYGAYAWLSTTEAF